MKTKLKHSSLAAFAVLLGAIANTEAATLDLTTVNASGTINGAFFTNTDVGATGTGLIDSFVRLQDNGVADGYNASARPVMPDVNTSPVFTHDLQLSAVPVVRLSGIDYYEFLLDINQTSNNPLLSLDKIDLYTTAAPLATANTLAALTGAGTLRYSLDAGSDSTILLNYTLNSGSGSGDMFAYIPTSAFGGSGPNTYVYLYSMFGAKGKPYAENDGFEEWAVRTPRTPPPPSVPEGGATLALLGLSLAGLAFGRRLISKKS